MEHIISFMKKKKEFQQRECPHINVIVDDAEWMILCSDCEKQLDPIWWISQMAKKEGNADFKLNRLIMQYEALQKKLESMLKTKCDHCGKMTTIKGV